jgi:hypothetical protein
VSGAPRHAVIYGITAPMLLSGLRVICPSKQINTLGMFFILLAHSAFAQSWTELSPSGTPPAARGGTTGVYDPTSNRMIVFGGRDGNGNNLNDVWILADANGAGSHPSEWGELIPNGAAGSPPARSGHSAVYDSVNNRMIIFGGCSANCAPVLNDVWVLANANGMGGTPAWTELSSGEGPAARTNAAVAYDEEYNELIVFGGQDGSANQCSTFTDVWVLTTANGLGVPARMVGLSRPRGAIWSPWSKWRGVSLRPNHERDERLRWHRNGKWDLPGDQRSLAAN